MYFTLHKNEIFDYRFLHQMWPNPKKTAKLVTFTAESLNGKLHFCVVVGHCQTSIMELLLWKELSEIVTGKKFSQKR